MAVPATYRCDDTRGCVMQFWPPDDEHMCSKHVEAWNKLIVKQKFCASSWLITEINILRCTVSKTSKFLYHVYMNSPLVLFLSHGNLAHTTPSHPIPLRWILILFFNLCLSLPSDHLSVFPIKILRTFQFSTYVPRSLCIIRQYVITRKVLVMIENREPPHYEIFSSRLFLRAP